MLAQLVINGLIAGSFYALVASGYSLIYSTTRLMHFAHGATIVFSAYFLFFLFSLVHFPFSIACILTLLAASGLGYLMNRGIYEPLRKKKTSNIILLIASLAILILIENLMILFFGSKVKTLGNLVAAKHIIIAGAILTPIQLVIIITSLVLLVGLYLFMHKTRLGRNIRAVSDNPELASISGINQKRMVDYSFLIGSFIAGIVGVFIALIQSISSKLGVDLMIKGFTSSIIAGIFSVHGSIIGGFLLGLVENLGIWVIPSAYKDTIGFLLLFVFLLFKPKGLFGVQKEAKE